MNGIPSGLLALLLAASPDAPRIDPVPRPVPTRTVAEWDFAQGADGWTAQNDCTLSADGGVLKVRSTGNDPYFHRSVDFVGGDLRLELRVRSSTGGHGEIFWTTDRSPHRGSDKSSHFTMTHDGAWHDYSVALAAPGRLTNLRIDPGVVPGDVEIDTIRLVQERQHPLLIEHIETAGDRVRFTVGNQTEQPQTFSADGGTHTIEGNATLVIDRPLLANRPLQPVTLRIELDDFPNYERTIFVHRPESADAVDWIAPSPIRYS